MCVSAIKQNQSMCMQALERLRFTRKSIPLHKKKEKKIWCFSMNSRKIKILKGSVKIN